MILLHINHRKSLLWLDVSLMRKAFTGLTICQGFKRLSSLPIVAQEFDEGLA
jgi:hypothetical protein